MSKDKKDADWYLIQIYEQNQKIIELLEMHGDRANVTAITPLDESQKSNAKKINSLTEREHQIMDMIMDGKLNKEMAFELSVSLSTIEAHRASIMRKLQVRNIPNLIKVYLELKPLLI